MSSGYIVVEKDDAGRHRRTLVVNNEIRIISGLTGNDGGHVKDFLTRVFLPSGYPYSVSSDYLRYQVLNALQAFCNSLASLLSSRAVLEGFGVGDPSATATHALLLTVVQDVFSRLTTIFGAYAFGSSLVPEAKTYRFLADVLNDAAVILDTLSPVLSSPSFPVRIPGLRVSALCLSASLRALCGIAAGGSKAAITLHFATPVSGSGDVGDLSAKDSSKETVLALLGMLLGTLIVPHLSTPSLTYGALFLLVALHLFINYLGIRGIELRSLNRQRTGTAWRIYRSSGDTKVPSPAEVSRIEHVLGQPNVFRDDSGSITGRCAIGSSFSDVFRDRFLPRLLDIFQQERYLLWYDHHCLYGPTGHGGPHVRSGPLHLHILLKEGYNGSDLLKAWCHAADACRAATSNPLRDNLDDEANDAVSQIETTFHNSARAFSAFVKLLDEAGWNVDDVALMTGSPTAVLTSVETSGGESTEDKKIR